MTGVAGGGRMWNLWLLEFPPEVLNFSSEHTGKCDLCIKKLFHMLDVLLLQKYGKLAKTKKRNILLTGTADWTEVQN